MAVAGALLTTPGSPRRGRAWLVTDLGLGTEKFRIFHGRKLRAAMLSVRNRAIGIETGVPPLRCSQLLGLL